MDRERQLDEVITAYLKAVEAGEPIDQAEWLQRHPDLADELAEFFAGQRSVERVAGPVRDALPCPLEREGLGERRGADAPTVPPSSQVAAPAESETIDPEPRDEGSQSRESKPGDRIRYFGDYELLAEIARGGMGVVYKARQVSLNRIVALKMILAGHLAREQDVKRFYSEAQTAANLQHPNIVAIHEVGEHKGQHYFSMDFVEGASLAALVREHPLPPEPAAAIVKTVAEAIHYAHQRGVLHRDLKPANVLLAASSTDFTDSKTSRAFGTESAKSVDRLVPKVTDFGLAKQIEADSRLTATGAVLGTPSYMPPEQASADRGAVGPAADIYSLGAVLYEMVTGRPPFQGPTPMDILLQVRSDDPVPPRHLQPKLPANLETICLKCLHKEPAKRYRTAADLAEDLRRFLAGEPILARPAGRVERLIKWVRRNPAVAALTAAVAATLIVGTAVASYYAVEADRRAVEADDNAKKARTQKDIADKERREALDQKNRADDERKLARKNEWQALQNLYVAHMNQAHRAWQDGQVGRVLDLLNAQDPAGAERPDFRGFEWHYLNRLCHSATRSFDANGPIQTVAYSQDGRLVASAGPGQSDIVLWDVDSGKEARRFRWQRGSIWQVSFDPEGKHLAAVEGKRFGFSGGNRRLKVWETATGREVADLAGDGCLAFSPDGKRLATLERKSDKFSDGAKVVVWDWQSGQRLREFKGHHVTITCLAFSPDGKRLAVGGAVGTVSSSGSSSGIGPAAGLGTSIRIWEVESAKELKALQHAGGVTCLAFSPNGKTLASGGGDKNVKVWNLESGKEELSLPGHSFVLSSVAFTKSGKMLASGAFMDNTIRLWDAATGQLIRTFKGHSQGVDSLAFSSDARHLVSGGEDKSVKIWQVDQDQESLSFSLRGEALGRLAFHADGKHIAYGGFGVSLWDAATGKSVRSFKNLLINFTVFGFALSADGKRLAVADPSTLRIWDMEKGRQIESFPQVVGISTLALSPDGQRLALPFESGVKIVSLSGEKTEVALDDRPARPTNLCFSPDGQTLALAMTFLKGEDVKSEIRLFDAIHGKLIHKFSKAEGATLALQFSVDGRTLFAASTYQVSEWDTDLGTEIRRFRPTPSRTACFSTDGERVACAGLDATVNIWDVRAGQHLLSLKGFSGQVASLSFNPAGTRLAASGFEGNTVQIRVWDGTPLERKPITIPDKSPP